MIRIFTISIVLFATLTLGCGQKNSAAPPSVATPPTAVADAASSTLAYWDGINCLPGQIAADMKGGPKEQVRALRGAANVIHRNPALGVDPERTNCGQPSVYLVFIF